MAASINKPAAISWKLWLPVLIWMGLIFYTSSMPGKDLPALFPHQDILYHLLTYAILTFLFSRAIREPGRNSGFVRVACLATAFGLFYGLSDELHQLFVPGRSCSGADLLVDTIGSLIGSLIQQWQR